MMMQWDGAGEMKGTEREREKEMGRAEEEGTNSETVSTAETPAMYVREYESCVSVDRRTMQCRIQVRVTRPQSMAYMYRFVRQNWLLGLGLGQRAGCGYALNRA